LIIIDNLKLKVVACKVIVVAAKGGKRKRKNETLGNMTGYRGMVGPLI
jgi:hypothetical protein